MKKLLMLGLISMCISCIKEKTKNEKEKIASVQPDVLSNEGIDSVLARFEKIKYNDLPESYLDYTDPKRKFEKELKSRFFYQIEGDEIYTKVVGSYMIKDFIAHDKYYKKQTKKPSKKVKQYWLIDKEVLYMLLELIQELEEGESNKYGFYIRCAHRHPTKNGETNGAKYSQHMFGRAIDIGIEDINKDGRNTQKDKAIVYDLLQKIVGNDGGLGKYPGSMNLHLDCRGFRARWDFP